MLITNIESRLSFGTGYKIWEFRASEKTYQYYSHDDWCCLWQGVNRLFYRQKYMPMPEKNREQFLSNLFKLIILQ